MFVMLVAQTGEAEDLSPALHLQDVQLLQKVLFNKWLSFSQCEAEISKQCRRKSHRCCKKHLSGEKQQLNSCST